MKGKAEVLVAFVLGLLLGIVGMFRFMGTNTQRVMAINAEAQLHKTAANARLLRTGQGETLLNHYDEAIPKDALAFHKEHRRLLKGQRAHAALWQVQRYYETSPSARIPADIRPVLGALPPRPVSRCEIRQKAPVQKETHEGDEPAEQEPGAEAKDSAD